MKKLLPAVLVIRVLFTDCKPGQSEWPKAVPEVTQSVSLTAAAEQTVSTIRVENGLIMEIYRVYTR